MYTRNYETAMTGMQQNHQQWLGDATDDFANSDDGDPDPLLQQLHLLAVQIVAQRQIADGILSNVSNADATVDLDALTTAMQNIASLTAQFRQVAAQRTAQNPYALSAADNAILAIGTWAQGVLNALPNAIAAIPNALVNAATNVIGNAGSSLTSAVVPWLIGGGLVLFLVMQAEKSRTYRKVVA